MKNLLAYRLFLYRGRAVSTAFKRCGQQGTMIQAVVDWQAYGAGTALPQLQVKLSFNGLGSGSIPDNFRIVSVYIDNAGSNFPVYVQFPDTGYTIYVPLNSAGWYPAITNQLDVSIYANGITDESVNPTSVYFTDLFVEPAFDPEIQKFFPEYLASPLPSLPVPNAVNTSGFGVPALGDQNVFKTIALQNNTPQQLMVHQVNGFYYITAIHVYLYSAAETAVVKVAIRNNAQVSVYEWSFVANTGGVAGQQIFSQSGLQKKLDAQGGDYDCVTLIGTTTGSVQFHVAFTFNAN